MGVILCFPSSATVMCPTGPKHMKDVQIGDTVRVVNAQGRPEWSKVCGWLHREPQATGQYLQLSTARRTLTTSAAHLVATVEHGQVHYKQAKEVQNGTSLLEVDDNMGAVWGSPVKNISTTQCLGVYAPLTEAGTIIVDGIAASCYASTHSHTVAHAAMKPMRAMYHHNPEKMSQMGHQGKHIKGSHKYVDLLARVTGKV